MSEPIIKICGVGKRFTLGESAGHDTLRDHLAAGLRSIIGRKKKARPVSEHWALRDVSFDVNEGEVVGIIGHNGAGKSTLLKILSQISEPTEGEIRVRGRIASLLEVGTGFHPELSGRENIYLNGAILGMKHAEIRAKFDEIVAFAEVEKFLDTPVKRYSSGMYVRLAFAVAAHLDPEILVVDEVLAVGDAAFQAKCLEKMGDAARHGGRTILFVSHNMQALRALCSRAVLLQQGRVAKIGDTASVLNRYLADATDQQTSRSWSGDDSPGNHQVRLRSVHVADEHGSASGVFSTSQRIFVDIEFECFEILSTLTVGFDLKTSEGDVLFRSYQTDQRPADHPPLKLGTQKWSCEIPAGLFNFGTYLVCPRAHLQGHYLIFEGPTAARFDTVLDHGVSPFWHKLKNRSERAGLISPILRWTQLNG